MPSLLWRGLSLYPMNLTKKQTGIIARLDKAAAKSLQRATLAGIHIIIIGKNPHIAAGFYTCWTDGFIMRLVRVSDGEIVPYSNAPENYPDVTAMLKNSKKNTIQGKTKLAAEVLAEAVALISGGVTLTDAGNFLLIDSDDRKTFVLVAKVRG